MVMSTKRFEHRNYSYHRRFSTITCRSIRCCGECRCLINSVLHRNHMVFGPELIKRRHCSYHRRLHLVSYCHVCCGEHRRLIISRHHRKHMCFGQELTKSWSSPLHYGAQTQADTQAIHIRLCIGAHVHCIWGSFAVVDSADVLLILFSIQNTAVFSQK
jgi:hypothetical protein